MAKLEFNSQHTAYDGLTDSEILVSREASGKNQLTEREKATWMVFKDALSDPMMILLVIACSMYFFTGKPHEGIIMIMATIAIAAISIFQGVRMERALKALRKLSQPFTTVIRNGNKTAIPSEEVVIGDIIIVSEGQQVTADAVLIEYNDLSVNESILTGESFPVEKSNSDNQLFSGTNITSGLAHARVTAVGNSTRIGKLGITMEQTHKEKTPLEKQVKVFVRGMTMFGFIAFGIVTVINALRADSWMAGLMEGLTLAMAVIPEEIPVALSTFMALGAYRMMRINVLVKQPQTVEALGAASVICLDKTGTITENRMKVKEFYDASAWATVNPDAHSFVSNKLLLFARLASEPIAFDPMEKAIVEAFDSTGLSITDYKMTSEYPLSGHPPFMTHVYTNSEGKRIIACKGAPEGILRNSLLNEDERKKLKLVQEGMAAQGSRVLAIATTDYNSETLPESQEAFQWNVLGLVALSDPPKQNIPEVIKSFYDAGIEVKMITGDYPQTASGIGKQIGLKNPDKFITGESLATLTDEELARKVYEVNIFARVQPEAKLRIVNALKANGEVVAMTGDGVNDGPALKAAHIGVAMGERGSEVARQAASLVLVNEDLASMVSAVALGRKIYSNLKKAIQYIITIHVPILSFVIVPLVLGWKYSIILFPVHIIFLELIMGPTCSIVYENEPIEEVLMKQRPRKFSNSFFSLKELTVSLLQGAVAGIGVLVVLYYCMQNSFNTDITRTLTFSTIIFSNLLLTLTGRSKLYTVFTTLRYKNVLLPVTLILPLILLAVFIYYIPLRNLFGFQHTSVTAYLVCFLVSAATVLWVEPYKYLKNRKVVN